MKVKAVQRFISRLAAGSLVGIIVGKFLDETFHTMPLFTLSLLAYVIFGSLYLLVKEAGN